MNPLRTLHSSSSNLGELAAGQQAGTGRAHRPAPHAPGATAPRTARRDPRRRRVVGGSTVGVLLALATYHRPYQPPPGAYRPRIRVVTMSVTLAQWLCAILTPWRPRSIDICPGAGTLVSYLLYSNLRLRVFAGARVVQTKREVKAAHVTLGRRRPRARHARPATSPPCRGLRCRRRSPP